MLLSLSLLPLPLTRSSLHIYLYYICLYLFPAFDISFYVFKLFLSSLSPSPADPLPDPLANFSLASSSANEGMFDGAISSKLKKLQNL